MERGGDCYPSELFLWRFARRLLRVTYETRRKATTENASSRSGFSRVSSSFSLSLSLSLSLSRNDCQMCSPFFPYLKSNFCAIHRRRIIITNEQAEVAEQEAVCYLRNVHMSPFKVRRVLDCIRGKSYEECLIMLEFMPYKACEPILSALFSAASNAKNNLGMNKAKLYVSECYADGAGTMKRFHPRAQGRPFPIRKRTCSITLKMKERD